MTAPTLDIGFLVYDGVQALDFIGPLEAFHEASNATSQGGYRLHTASLDGRPIRSETGLTFVPDGALADMPRVHTLVIPGGEGARHRPCPPDLIAELRRRAGQAERVVSICTGAFLVAEAGLAAGKRMTTHWRHGLQLAALHPDIRVEVNQLHLADGALYSSAGVLAGVDLALALIEEDLGEAVASTVARSLVVYLRRSGGQTQFSDPLRAQGRTAHRFAALEDWLRENLSDIPDVETLASRAGYSPRHFRRVLQREVNATPGQFVEDVKLDVARNLLAAGSGSIKQVATATGFRSADVFRRAFRRRFMLSPVVYRERFSLRPADAGEAS